jgi:hypothetical protein
MAGFFKRVKDGIVGAATRVLNRATERAIHDIELRIGRESLDIWKQTSTYQSLTNSGGDLFHQFGFYPEDAINLVDSFLEEASKNVRVEFKQFKPGLKRILGGGIQIFVLKESLDEALDSNGAYFITEKGDSIDWARWLLLEGNKFVISRFKFKPGSPEFSRSGDGIMIKAKSGGFRVPSEHQGITGNNWLTRSLTQSLDEISERYSVIIKSEIVRNL